MSDWFTTTGANYLSRISRSAIETAVSEAKGEQKALAVKAASKKTEAIAIAERLLEGSNWIPAPLRITPAVVTVAGEGEAQEEYEHQIPEAAE